MINILKFKKEDGDKIFFFSDFHHSHAKLLESRGFPTIEEHDETIINNWNSVVDNNSIVFFLGDLVLGAGEKSKEVYSQLLEKLNYKELYCGMGNHGAGYKQLFNRNLEFNQIDKYYRLNITHQSLYENGCKLENLGDKKIYFIPNYYEIFIGNQPVILSHYPILSFNGQRNSAIHLHGHCHNSLHKTEWIDKNYYAGRVMDVGYEGIKNPISFNQIKEIMDKREIRTFDHH